VHIYKFFLSTRSRAHL